MGKAKPKKRPGIVRARPWRLASYPRQLGRVL
jgi:hypothetical protein